MLLQRQARGAACNTFRAQPVPVVTLRCRRVCPTDAQRPRTSLSSSSASPVTESFDKNNEDDVRSSETRARYPPRYDESVEDEGADWDPSESSGTDDSEEDETKAVPAANYKDKWSQPAPAAPVRAGRSGRLGPQASALASFDDRDGGQAFKKAAKAPTGTAAGKGKQSLALASFSGEDDEDSVMDKRMSRAARGPSPLAPRQKPAPPTGVAPEAQFEDDDADLFGENEAADRSFDDDDAFDWRDKAKEATKDTVAGASAEMDESFDEEDYQVFLAALKNPKNAKK